MKRYLPLVVLSVLAVTLYCLYAEVPTLVQNIEVDGGNKSSDMRTKTEVWDTMDGRGYQFREKVEQPLDPRYEELNNLPLCGNLGSTGVQQEVINLMETVKKQFSDCIAPIVDLWKDHPKEMNLEWVAKAAVCDKLPILEKLKVVPFNNYHETKWAILPKCKEENVLVTMGIGHDTTAEERLNRTISNTKFYGADPIIEPNRQMYSAFGKFFPFAIGKNPGFTRFRVLPNQSQKTRKYIYQDVTTIPFLYFLHDILKLQKIDFAWIDIEGGEFEFLDQIHHEVQFCQFNLEVHSAFNPAGAPVFHDFIFKILEQKKYVFLQSEYTGPGAHRMFFLNVEDKQCLAKYFNKF
ncbi:Methyltransferase FkbM domain-containing protein [Caenorhabditis elegans]|uniref:Methyltransferase FkbM domain-containing protein n=1 Tax=Caenorhabditis elegans TaxID=6239 RepID=Q23394_CAEEL|nr:Methyltransferase FkbM domain-containing protein [Caenorhabditis elegans]CAA94222.4 Methyltransferase FkbM domain-containing protein [Caenorhabditis elegans]|eukprot:NP_001355362.1 Uncharacterized protein CELE_ZK1086.3 [Caenorhabditis elegans]